MATTKNLNCLWNYHHCHCIQKLHFSSSQHSYDCSPLEPFDWRCAAGCECPISNTINAITVLVFTIISTIRIFIILLFYYLFIFICTLYEVVVAYFYFDLYHLELLLQCNARYFIHHHTMIQFNPFLLSNDCQWQNWDSSFLIQFSVQTRFIFFF